MNSTISIENLKKCSPDCIVKGLDIVFTCFGVFGLLDGRKVVEWTNCGCQYFNCLRQAYRRLYGRNLCEVQAGFEPTGFLKTGCFSNSDGRLIILFDLASSGAPMNAR